MTNVHHFHSEGLELVAHLEVPESTDELLPGVLLVHGFPEGPGGGANSARTLPELANRISSEVGFITMAPLLRGTGESEGCFSLRGWLTDVRQAILELDNYPRVGQIWLVGFGSGGAISICAAALEEKVKGVGFDFENSNESFYKVIEEINEFNLELNNNNVDKASDEFGDILFALISYAQNLGINAVNALEKTNEKFIKRFHKMEEFIAKDNKHISDYSKKELNAVWNNKD